MFYFPWFWLSKQVVSEKVYLVLFEQKLRVICGHLLAQRGFFLNQISTNTAWNSCEFKFQDVFHALEPFYIENLLTVPYLKLWKKIVQTLNENFGIFIKIKQISREILTFESSNGTTKLKRPNCALLVWAKNFFASAHVVLIQEEWGL